MAIQRDRPYVQFNFLVNLGTDDSGGLHGGFDECSNLEGVELTLRGGVTDSLALSSWLDQLRDGGEDVLRTVTIQRQNDDRTAVVSTWTLKRARIIKHVSGPLNAKGTDVAMEELTLAYERLQME